MKKSIIILCSLILIMYACTNSNDDTGLEDIPVVNSYLYPSDTFKVHVSKLTPYGNNLHSTDIEINELKLYAGYNGTLYLLKNMHDGNFIDSTNTIPLLESKIYTLNFNYGDEAVFGETSIPSKPINIYKSASTVAAFDFENHTPGSMPEPLEISWENTDNSYYLVVVENIESDPVEINTDEGKEKVREFRSEPGKIDEFRIMPMMFEYYGTHRIIIFHLNEDYAALYEEQNTNSLNLTRPTSSLQNAFGVFTGVNADTISIEVE